MFELIRNWIEEIGIGETGETIVIWIVAILIIAVTAYLTDLIVKRILLRFLRIVAKKTKSNWDDILLERKLFQRISHLAPAMVVYFFAPGIPEATDWIQRLSLSGMIIIGAFAFNALLNSAVDIYNTYEISREKPIKSYLQIFMIFIYVLVGVFVIATLLNRSPWVLLSGIGAMTAILLLIFKDSILGLVAGFQLSANRMIRLGDWIEMPRYGADGDVIDISLHTVKVQNWDKTITTIPTYALISDSFKNWRGMSESGGRRIKRAIHIDMSSVKFCDDEMIKRYAGIELLKDYVAAKKKEIDEYNRSRNVDPSEPANGRKLTNIGTFRAYMVNYLKNHPMISDKMTFLVRHLSPTQNGLPIEIYVFSKDQEWANYEAIQADIFDHILAVVPEFELRVFQNPTGYDFRGFGEKATG